MNSFIHFWHHLLNPHCELCRAEWQEEKEDARICQSCEVLKVEIERQRIINDRLLTRFLNPSPEQREIRNESVESIKPRHIPWNVKRQMLEAEDRERARLMREAPKPSSDKEVENLEKELGVKSAD